MPCVSTIYITSIYWLTLTEQIRNSHLYDLGAGGIWIRDQVDNAEVYNNYVHSGGHVFEAAVGIMVHKSHNIQIHNNEVSDFSYTGISVGWTWGHGVVATSNISIAYNRVHMIGKMVLSDLGGIYTLGYVSPDPRTFSLTSCSVNNRAL